MGKATDRRIRIGKALRALADRIDPVGATTPARRMVGSTVVYGMNIGVPLGPSVKTLSQHRRRA